MLLHVFRVVLYCLSFVRGVEINSGVIFLDRLKVHLEGFLDTVLGQLVGRRNYASLERTIKGRH